MVTYAGCYGTRVTTILTWVDETQMGRDWRWDLTGRSCAKDEKQRHLAA